MSLPKSIRQNLPDLLTQDRLLAQELASEVISNLEKDTPINWSILINKQLEIETPELLAHATREGVHRFTKEIQ